jgi:acyl dehydratase
MGINPDCLGATTTPRLVTWTDRDTLLYALGVGAGVGDLALTTENSHDVPQQVLPTFAVIVAAPFDAVGVLGTVSLSRMLHGGQGIRVHRPLPAAGSLSLVSEVTDLQDKGEGRNAVVTLTGRASDPDSGDVVAETATTIVFRGEGGFGGPRGQRAEPVTVPDRLPDAIVDELVDERQALLYRLSGDRNPLHSDPWFAREKAGFPKPILHGLCTYGFACRALVRGLGGDSAARVTAMDARFTAPVFPGERLVTSMWRDPGVFRVEAHAPDGSGKRVVLDDGRVELSD